METAPEQNIDVFEQPAQQQTYSEPKKKKRNLLVIPLYIILFLLAGLSGAVGRQLLYPEEKIGVAQGERIVVVEKILDMQGNTVENVGDPVQDDDAVNLGYAEENYIDSSGDILAGNFTVAEDGTFTLEDIEGLILGSTFLSNSVSVNQSGASLIGVYDQFDNSTSKTLQNVLHDFDTAITELYTEIRTLSDTISTAGGTEIDPVFSASAVGDVSDADVTSWSTAYDWGDHSEAGYVDSSGEYIDPDWLLNLSWSKLLNIPADIADGDDNTTYSAGVGGGLALNGTEFGLIGTCGDNQILKWDDVGGAWACENDDGSGGETDPVFTAHVASGITGTDISNWDEAYGWGDHSVAGYLTSESDPQVGTITTNYVPKWNGTALVTGSIYDNGSIGIGTTSPSEKLHLYNGTLLVDNPSSITLEGTFTPTGNTLGVYVSGKYAYLANGAGGMQVVNINNPSSPSLVGTYNTSGNAYDISISGKYAYVADGASGLVIIDVSDPTAPGLTGTYNTASTAQDVYMSGKYAYVADGYGGLYIIDVSNPASPRLEGRYDSDGYSSGVYVLGRYAYVADDMGGFIIVDVSDPTSPSFVGGYDYVVPAAYVPQSIYVSGKYAYLGNAANLLEILDVSDPTNPTVVGDYVTGGWVNGVHVSGKYLYMAVGDVGLQVLDISNPSNPVLRATLASSSAFDIYVSGKYAYLADTTIGLRTVDILGADVYAAKIGSLESNNISVTENVNIGNDLYVRSGITVGLGGIHSDGALGVNSGLSSYFGGNVGIGTTNPLEDLHVADNIYTEDNLFVGSRTETLANSGFALDGDDLFVAGMAGIEGNVYTDGSFIAGSGTLTLSDSGIVDSNSDLLISATGNDVVLQSSGGNVGIGTTTPSDLLHVHNGGIFVDGTSTTSQYLLDISGKANVGKLKIDNFLVSSSMLSDSFSLYTEEELDVDLSTSTNWLFEQTLWQSFTATTDGILTKVSLKLVGIEPAPSSMSVYIYTGEGTGGILLGTGTLGTPVADWCTITLDDSVMLESGQQYTAYIVATGDPMAREHNVNNPYAGGRSSYNSSWDLQFRTYMIDEENSRLYIASTGDVGVGTNSPESKLQVTGGGLCVGSDANCNTDNNTEGVVYSSATSMSVYDVAENYPTKDDTLLPGEILVLDEENGVFVERVNSSEDEDVLGIVSTEPGVLLGGFAGKEFQDEHQVAVALAGRVPVFVSTENGDIAIGDPITSSSIPGVGMKATNQGRIVGRALEAYSGTRVGKIQVFVNNSWYEPQTYAAKIDEILAEYDAGNLFGSVTSIPNDLVVNSITAQVGTFAQITGSSLLIGNGSLMIDAAGNVVTSGVITSDRLVATSVQAQELIVSASQDLGIVLGDSTGDTGLVIKDSEGNEKIRFTSDGKIEFAEPILEEDPDSSTGEGIILIGETEFYVNNSLIDEESRIFVTSKTPIAQAIAVVDKYVDESVEIDGVVVDNFTGFKVAIINPESVDVEFDYWIIN